MSVGYRVTMMVRVYDRKTNRILKQPHSFTCVVQPPPWCSINDLAVLEMHLHHCAQLRYLLDARKRIASGDSSMADLKGKDWSVKGTMLDYKNEEQAPLNFGPHHVTASKPPTLQYMLHPDGDEPIYPT